MSKLHVSSSQVKYRHQPFDRVLAECLEAMIMEDYSIHDLINRHPEHRDHLAELLTVAKTAHKVPTAKEHHPTRVHKNPLVAGNLSSPPATSTDFWSWLLFIFEQLRPNLASRATSVSWALAAIMVFTLFTGGTVGVAYAADNAKPGDVLYGMDRALETIQWTLTFDPARKVELGLAFAQERTAEVQRLTEERAPLRAVYSLLMDQQTQLEQASQFVAQVQGRVEETQALLLSRELAAALSNREYAINQVADHLSVSKAMANTQGKPAAARSGHDDGRSNQERQSMQLAPGLNQPQTTSGPALSLNIPGRLASLDTLQQQAQLYAEQGRGQAAKIWQQEYENQVHLLAQALASIDDNSDRAEALAALVAEAHLRHNQVLTQLAERLPESAWAGLERAIEASNRNQGQGPPAEVPGSGSPDSNPGGGPPDDNPGGGPPNDNPGGGPPDTPPGQNKRDK